MILRLLLVLVLVIMLNNPNALKLKFNPSDTLKNLSSEINFKLLILIKKSFLNEDFWPILTSLNKARYYNFPQVLSATLEHIKCFPALEIILSPNFPVKELLTADILSNPKLSPCFNLLPDDFFLEMTPLESSQYKPFYWEPAKHTVFLESAYTNPSIKTDWNSWCFDPQLTLNHIESSITWRIVNFYCIQAFPEIISSKLLENLSPASESINIPNFLNPSSTSSSSTTSSSSSAIDVDFGVSQTMKIVSISTFLIVFPKNHDLYNKAKYSLISYLKVSKLYDEKFPLQLELKRFLKNVLASHPSRRESFEKIDSLLLKILRNCKGQARGTWILNIFIIWNHFRVENQYQSTALTSFLDEFVTIFLCPESFTTVPDICLFLKLVNYIFSELKENNHSVIQRIFRFHLFSNPLLSREIMKECPFEIPKSKRANNLFFPFHFKVEQLFKKTRFIDKFLAPSIAITLKLPAKRVCYSIFHVIDNILDTKDIPLLPMNTKVIYRKTFLDGNFPKMLEIFFQNLILSTDWFIQSETASEKPIILPSLTLPPHFMEYIGFLMGKAVISNVKIPFFIDKKYFELSDALEVKIHGPPLSNIALLIEKIHPDLNNYVSNLQVHRITLALDFSSIEVLEYIQADYIMGPVTLPEPEIIENLPYNMNRIVLMGAEKLRIGLDRALPTGLLTTDQLYNLIFK